MITQSYRAGGLDVVDLALAPGPAPGFVGMRLIPAHGLMLLQARVRLADGREADLLAAPEPAEAAPALAAGSNAAFSFGGAILAPYANRVRGTLLPGGQAIEASVNGRPVRLPANGGGQAPGAERYSIHGLILAAPVTELRTEATPGLARASGVIEAGDFGAGWPSLARLEILWELRPDALDLRVVARNVGPEVLPVGIGWHPYFALPSGDRTRATLRVPARARLPVNDYDAVLPTGEVVSVAGTGYDFRAAPALGARFLDDCFVELERDAAGAVVCEVADPVAGHGVRITAPSPEVSAVQTFAPPARPFVVVEPQFNWADPFGAGWGGRPTGMRELCPGEAVDYAVTLTLFTP